MHHCKCPHHTQEDNTGKLSVYDQNINHLISLLQDTFISPYKIMYLLDPKQADNFKNRN